MRRVVHVTAATVMGGLLTHVARLAPRTGAHGWESQVVFPPGAALDGTADALESREVIVHRESVRGKGDLRGLLAMRRLVSIAAPDLLHVHLSSPVESLPLLLGVPRRGTLRIVTTEHAPSHHPAERPWSRLAKRRSLARIARVIALSSPDAGYLESVFHVPPEKLRRVPNGVPIPESPPDRDGARRRLGLGEGDEVIGYVGALAESKGLKDLVEAVAALAPARPVPVVLLGGEGDYAAEIREQAEAAGIGARVRLLGLLHPPDDLYAACDLFVLPSHGEAMPLALLEAMAAGRPVVATEVGGIPDVVRNGVEGTLVPSRQPRALSAAIGALLADARGRERMGRAARARVESGFSLDRMVAATCALYDEVVSGPRA